MSSPVAGPRILCLLGAGVLLLTVLFGCGGREGPDSRPPAARVVLPDTLSLFVYNVENLFDMVSDGTEYDEYVPGQCGWTETMMEAKVQASASVIASARADLVVLCEVENPHALSLLIKALRQERCPYGYWAMDTVDRGTAVRQAVLSRYPLENVSLIAAPARGSGESGRGTLEADCRIGTASIKIFAVHWPSKSKPESSRVACARALAGRIAELPPGTDYVIAGDFNASYDECETMRMSKLDDTRGLSSVNHILKTVTTAPGQAPSFVSEDAVARLGAGWHFEPWMELPASRRCSYVHQARCETPDHILLGASLFDSAGFSYVDNSFGAYTWDGRLLNDGAPFRWQMRFSGRKRVHAGQGYSDHLPLVAKLRPGGFTPGPPNAAADTVAVHIPRARTSTMDGWIPGDKKARCRAESVDGGGTALRVEGEAPRAALPVLRRVLSIAPGSSRVVVRLRGSGKIGLRLRARDGRWWYYSPPEFAARKSARYVPWEAADWTTVNLSLAPLGTCSEAELEVRAGKDAAFGFWIRQPEVK